MTQAFLYFSDDRNQLWRTDVATFSQERIGDLGVLLMDLAVSPDGVLYGVSATTLYRIDTTNAALVAIGNLGLGYANANALAFDPAGNAYLATASTPALYRVNLQTGSATLAGTNQGGYRSDGDLVFVDNKLFMSAQGGRIVHIDPATGNSLKAVAHGISNLFGLSADESGLYAFAGRNVYRLDPDTGTSTLRFTFSGQTGSIYGASAVVVDEADDGSDSGTDDGGDTGIDQPTPPDYPQAVVLEYFAKSLAYDDILFQDQQAWSDFQEAKWQGVLDYRIDTVFSHGSFLAVALTSPTRPSIVAIRGTTGGFLDDDWEQNADPLGVGYREFVAAWTNTDLKNWLQSHPGATITGHSQGGAQAQLLAAAATSAGIRIGDLMTFNSPGVGLQVPFLFNPANAGSVTHVVSSGDIVQLSGLAFLPGEIQRYRLNSFDRDESIIDYILRQTHTGHWVNQELYGSALDDGRAQVPGIVSGHGNLGFVEYQLPTFGHLHSGGKADAEYFTFLVAVSKIPKVGPLLAAALASRAGVESARQAGAIGGVIIDSLLTLGEGIQHLVAAAHDAAVDWLADAFLHIAQWSEAQWALVSTWSASQWEKTKDFSLSVWEATVGTAEEIAATFHAMVNWSARQLNDAIEYLWNSTVGFVTGLVQDGYVAGASIFIDYNGNGLPDPEENTGLVTDSQGQFAGVIAGSAPLIAAGGTNTDTGLANTIPLVAPSGASVISPLTSLVQTVIDTQALDAAAAAAQITKALDIPAGIDLLSFDALAHAASDPQALAVQKINVQLALAGTLAGAAAGQVLDSIARATLAAADSGTTLDLADAAALRTIMEGLVVPRVRQTIAAANAGVRNASSLQEIADVQSASLLANVPVGSDWLAPTVVSIVPAAGTRNTALDSDIVIAFSEAVRRGVGSIMLRTADGELVESFHVTTAANLNVAGQQLVLSPDQPFRYGVEYRLEIPAGAITDLAGNPYVGTGTHTFATLPNVVLGTMGDDLLQGTVLNDYLAGLDGNDLLVAGAGDDLLDGGNGLDTASFAGPRAAYTMALLEHSVQAVTDTRGIEGIAILTGIERLQFSDHNVALDLDGAAGQVARILGAVFGRDAIHNAQYAGIGLALLDEGLGYQELLLLALDVALGKTRDNSTLVNLLYGNVVGMPPPKPQLDYFVNLIEDGSYSQLGLAMMAADHPLNLAGINLVGLTSTGLDYLPVV